MKTKSKIKKLIGKENLEDRVPAAKARPGAWKQKLLPQEKIHKNTEIPPIVQEEIITAVSNGAQPKDIEKKYKVSLSYVRDVFVRRFGNRAAMKEALTLMGYENAMAFMAHAQTKTTEMSGPQAVLAAKLSVDTSLALEKGSADEPEEIDFTGLMSLGSAIKKVEKVLGEDKVKVVTSCVSTPKV